MTKKINLSKSMTEVQFDNGYWYADDIKAFAKQIGIPHISGLRKDELEKLIKYFLRTGKVKSSAGKNIISAGVKDLDRGLSLNLPVINYTGNKQTKDFIVKEAKRIVPDLKNKSGARYRLNRWREEQISKSIKIKYGDLVSQFIKLSQVQGSFRKIPVGRYINFVANYLAGEKDSTRSEAVNAWKELKRLDIPKDYKSWKKYQSEKK